MAILNATAMERDLVNLGWSVPVQKCQQIFETVAARHRSTLHYCLSRYSPCGLVRGRLALLTPMRSTSDLAFRVRVLASVGSPNLIQDFAPLSIRPRTLGSPMNEERRHFRDAKAEASEFRLTQEAPFVSISESQRAPLPGLNGLATIHYGPSDLLELCEQREGKELFRRQPGIDLIYERTTACECGLNVGHDCTLSNAYMGLT